MGNYELTVEAIANYKNKACDFAGSNYCDKCEAMFWDGGNQWCCFDTVARFVEYANKHKL